MNELGWIVGNVVVVVVVPVDAVADQIVSGDYDHHPHLVVDPFDLLEVVPVVSCLVCVLH